MKISFPGAVLPSTAPINDSLTMNALVIATSAALATLAPVAFHQIGILPRLPDPPGAIFASDRITGSEAAHPLGIPDGILGLSSYGTTLALAICARTRPRVRKLLALKLLADGSLAGLNVVRQVVSFRRLCSWCTGTVLCTAGMLIAGRRLIAEELRSPVLTKSGHPKESWR